MQLTYKDKKFFVQGNLDFTNVARFYSESLPQFKQHANLKIDFSLLKSSNSAVFALIVEWTKFAKKYRKHIHFENLSKDLLSIAKAAGIEKLVG